MNNSPAYFRLSLRFRRWSRKAWAVFASVGQVVSIGTLSDGIAERSMIKAHAPVGTCGKEGIDHSEEEQDELETVQLQVVEFLPVSLAVPAGAATILINITTIFNGWYGFGRISRFFMFPNLYDFCCKKRVYDRIA
jgi:hypothetical protein